ncbi:hypothetical protein SAMN05216168_0727 [Kosakonia radicincitans]|nr:hypothetical protein SAMN03159294_3991 [Kosakonia radicincitans]SKC06542.1 hypothetical protein SAMN05216168_0727 [Kosakonia radicincitans]
MSMIRVVGIDIAKSVFQVCVWMVDGSVAWNKKSLSPNCWILSDSSNPERLLQCSEVNISPLLRWPNSVCHYRRYKVDSRGI